MKKFLFTLAMLLMAGAAFADSYLYINKADVLTGEQNVEVPVKAHFSEYVSAWQVTITLPDGINFDGRADVGQDMTIPYFTDRGRTANYTLSLSQNGVGGFVAASQQDGFYKLNGTWTSHGAIKWAPGDYDEMIILYLEVTDAYTGGDIMITTEPMCGADPRDIPMAVVEGGRTLPWVDDAITAAEPTLAVDNEENPTQVITNGVLYYCDETMTPGAWNIVDAPYTLPQATDVEQKLHFMAYTPNDEGKNDSKFVTLEVTIPAKAQDAPEPTIEMDENYQVSAVVYDEEGNVVERVVKLYTVELDEEGNEVEGSRQEVANPYAITQTYEDQSYTFVAVTIANDGESEDTECDPVTFNVPGKEKDYAPTPTISKTEDGTKVQATVNEDGYEVVLMLEGENGEYAPCANPYTLPAQTYEEQTLNFKAYTKKNGEYYDSPETEVFTVTIPALDKDYAPTPTISKTEDGTKVQATVDKDGYEVVLMLEGENGYAPCDNPYTLPENTSYTDDIVLNFKAYTKKNGEYYDSPETEVFTVTIPHKTMDQAVKPKITFTPDNGGVTVKIEDYTEYTIKVNGTQVDPTRNEHNYYVEKGDVDKEIVVYAKNAPENMIAADTTATYLLAAKTVYNTPNPVIGEPTVNDNDVTFTVTGEGTITVTVTNGDQTETYTGTGEVEVTIPRTDKDVTYTVNATAKSNKEGYDVINEGTASTTVTVPALQTEKPTITYEYGTAEFDDDGNVVVDGRYATITITNNDEKDAVIEYSLDGGETWNTYNPEVPVTVSGEGTHTVMARAKAEGKALSEVESVDIKIDKTTSVNELVNGKTVAGVRYFNMAGQEMQEANGITIVVTTYTDGTTSAVKVMK